MSFDWLFTSSSSESDSDEKMDSVVDDGSDDVSQFFVPLKRGRQSMNESHPELVPCISDFIRQNTAAAHLRRRDTAMYTNGVSLQQIVDHVFKTLRVKVSRSTIRRLCLPSRKNTINGRRHKGLVNARIPPKNNSGERQTHPHFHYTASQINTVQQMATLYSRGTLQLSVDNKNKIDVGTLAVNRRCKINRFCLVPDAPVYNDHDFPYRNSKLTPSGYQVLRSPIQRTRSLSPPRRRPPRRRTYSEEGSLESSALRSKDSLGRDSLKWSRNGPLTVEIYPSRLIEATNIVHIRNMKDLLQREYLPNEVYNVISIADGGPDWSVKSVQNFMSLGLFWKEMKLDMLVVQCYAPHHSRFNPIERYWSPLTKWLVGVTFPVELNGAVPNETDAESWNTVLNEAANTCAKFWNNKKVDGHTIHAKPFSATNSSLSDLKEMHNLLKDFVDASAKRLREDPDMNALQKIYRFLVLHADRKPYQIEFKRCQEVECPHCTTLPQRNNELLDAVRSFGGTFPIPTETFCFLKKHRGHYDSFLSQYNSLSYNKRRISPLYSHGVCEHGCNYGFFSESDKSRHYRLMQHKKQRVQKLKSKNQKIVKGKSMNGRK